MPVRLAPLIQPAPDAILVGDPRRAFALAQAVIVEPKMSHLARGLWGYTGRTEAGGRLTVQSTGIGGPGAVTVIADLADLGLERLVRLGTCVATDEGAGVAAGRPFLVSAALPGDGASAALTGGDGPVLPDAGLSRSLEPAAPAARVFSHDLPRRVAGSAATGDEAPLRDLQTAASFAIASRLGIRAAAILVVAESASGERPGEEELLSVFRPLAGSAAAALARHGDDRPDASAAESG